MLSVLIFDGIGTLGVFFCLLAYLLLSVGKITGHQLSYIWLNLFGALGILISMFYQWNFSSFLMEFSWLVISVYSLARYYFKKS